MTFSGFLKPLEGLNINSKFPENWKSGLETLDDLWRDMEAVGELPNPLNRAKKGSRGGEDGFAPGDVCPLGLLTTPRYTSVLSCSSLGRVRMDNRPNHVWIKNVSHIHQSEHWWILLHNRGGRKW